MSHFQKIGFSLLTTPILVRRELIFCPRSSAPNKVETSKNSALRFISSPPAQGFLHRIIIMKRICRRTVIVPGTAFIFCLFFQSKEFPLDPSSRWGCLGGTFCQFISNFIKFFNMYNYILERSLMV